MIRIFGSTVEFNKRLLSLFSGDFDALHSHQIKEEIFQSFDSYIDDDD